MVISLPKHTKSFFLKKKSLFGEVRKVKDNYILYNMIWQKQRPNTYQVATSTTTQTNKTLNYIKLQRKEKENKKKKVVVEFIRGGHTSSKCAVVCRGSFISTAPHIHCACMHAYIILVNLTTLLFFSLYYIVWCVLSSSCMFRIC